VFTMDLYSMLGVSALLVSWQERSNHCGSIRHVGQPFAWLLSVNCQCCTAMLRSSVKFHLQGAG